MSKEEFLKALIKEGLSAGYSNEGVPTVYVESPSQIDGMNRIIKPITKELGYTQSYGISLIYKKDDFHLR